MLLGLVGKSFSVLYKLACSSETRTALPPIRISPSFLRTSAFFFTPSSAMLLPRGRSVTILIGPLPTSSRTMLTINPPRRVTSIAPLKMLCTRPIALLLPLIRFAAAEPIEVAFRWWDAIVSRGESLLADERTFCSVTRYNPSSPVAKGLDVYHIIALGLFRGLWFFIHVEAEELV